MKAKLLNVACISLLLLGFVAIPTKAEVFVNVDVNLNFAPTYEQTPAPVRLVQVAPSRKRMSRDWAEYETDHPTGKLIVIYREEMPRKGWTLVEVRGNTYLWAKGPRRLKTAFFSANHRRGGVAVSEYRIHPKKDKHWKHPGKGKAKGKWKK